MKITDLDEFQGLAGTDVHAWMLRNGWKRTEDDFVFERGSTVLRAFLNDDLLRLAAEHRLSPQALLREINPRMRKGMPSLAAWEAHGGKDGWWIGVWNKPPESEHHWQHLLGRPIVTRIRRYEDVWEWGVPGTGWADCPEMPQGKDWSFWPCDANGNKVRWPTDAHGNML